MGERVAMSYDITWTFHNMEVDMRTNFRYFPNTLFFTHTQREIRKLTGLRKENGVVGDMLRYYMDIS